MWIHSSQPSSKLNGSGDLLFQKNKNTAKKANSMFFKFKFYLTQEKNWMNEKIQKTISSIRAKGVNYFWFVSFAR